MSHMKSFQVQGKTTHIQEGKSAKSQYRANMNETVSTRVGQLNQTRILHSSTGCFSQPKQAVSSSSLAPFPGSSSGQQPHVIIQIEISNLTTQPAISSIRWENLVWLVSLSPSSFTCPSGQDPCFLDCGMFYKSKTSRVYILPNNYYSSKARSLVQLLDSESKTSGCIPKLLQLRSTVQQQMLT